MTLLQLQSKIPGGELNVSDCNGFDGISCIVKTSLFKSSNIYNFCGEKRCEQLIQRSLCILQNMSLKPMVLHMKDRFYFYVRGFFHPMQNSGY